MPVVRIKNKKVFDDIQAQLILRLDRKITQQETLELCVKLGSQNIEQLVRLASSQLILTPEIAEHILKDFEHFQGSIYNSNARFVSDIDNDAYL